MAASITAPASPQTEDERSTPTPGGGLQGAKEAGDSISARTRARRRNSVPTVFFITHPDVVIDPEVPVPEWPLSQRAPALPRRPQKPGIPVWVLGKKSGSQRVSRLCDCELAPAITAPTDEIVNTAVTHGIGCSPKPGPIRSLCSYPCSNGYAINQAV